MKVEIEKLEEELRQAMLISDIKKLDELIADCLIFIAPDGSVASKQTDLDIHRSGIQKMTKLVPSEQNILTFKNFAVVTVKMQIEGSLGEANIAGNYRYTRTWAKINDRWQIIAGAVVPVNV